MKFARFQANDRVSYGIIEDEKVHEVTGDVYLNPRRTGRSYELGNVRLLAPCEPSKVIAIGLNYAAHAAEGGKAPPESPIVFMKAQTAIVGPGDPIILPTEEHRIDHEAELVVVIGKRCRNVSRDHALDYVFGYTCGNDVSDRIIQRKDGQWVRAKSFDTFCPLGPWIETELSPASLDIKAVLNGEIKQHSNTSHLIFDVPFLIEFVSNCMTLLPGDIIMTGTPDGVSPVKNGDVVEIVVEGIGTLRNPVVYNG